MDKCKRCGKKEWHSFVNEGLCIECQVETGISKRYWG